MAIRKNTRSVGRSRNPSRRARRPGLDPVLRSIAELAFSVGFIEMQRHVARVNPNGSTRAFVRNALRAMRESVERREAAIQPRRARA